jgi:uncharacterized membrane protein
MKKGLVVIGVILLIIGIILAVVGMLPALTSVKAEDIEYDDTGGYADYNDGDEVLITGEITNETEVPGGYEYVLDENIQVSSGEDIGDEGDTVTLLCEVEEMDLVGITFERMKAKAIYQQINFLMIMGLILVIVGIIVIILGFRKGGPETAPEQPPIKEPDEQPPIPPE